MSGGEGPNHLSMTAPVTSLAFSFSLSLSFVLFSLFLSVTKLGEALSKLAAAEEIRPPSSTRMSSLQRPTWKANVP